MKSMRIAVILTVLMVITCATVSAERFSVTSVYSMPINNEKIDQSLSIGINYQFWGVFQFTFNMYNDIVMGADNLLNIRTVRPIGLFSGGVGMKIPLGGFHLLFDWQKYFAGTASNNGVFAFSDSYAFGVSLDLSDFFGIEIMSRRLYNFSERTIQDSALRVDSKNDALDTLSLGVEFHIF